MGKFFDYANKTNKKKEDKKITTSTSPSLGNFGKYAVSKTIGLNTLSSDLDTLSKSVSNAYSGWQSRETMQNTLSSMQSMYDRLGKYQEYSKTYGGTDLTELRDTYKGIIDDWDSLSRKYSGYDNAEAYNKAVSDSKALYEKQSSADIGVLQTEIDGLEDILKNVEAHQSNIRGLEAKRNTWEHRSNGLKTDMGYGSKVTEAQTELDKYLKSVGYDSVDALKKDLGDKKVFKTQAERLQNLNSLSSVGDKTSKNYDKDFEKYVASGQSIPTDEVGTSKRRKPVGHGRSANTPKVNDDLREVALAFERRQNGQTSSNSDSYYDRGAIFDLMTDEEFNNFYYYLGKDKEDGGNKAQEYVDAIAESLNSRRGEQIAKLVEDKPWGELGFSIEAGLDQWSSGMKANFSDKDYIPTSSMQYASGIVRENVEEDYGKFWRTMYDLGVTGANQLPSILASTALGSITGGAGGVAGKVLSGVSKGAGLATMGISARGNAYQEMLSLGYDKDQASTYANLTAASEVGLQALLGGIGKLGGTSGKIAKLVEGIDNGFARFAIQWGGSVASEATEEGLQEILNPLFQNIAAGYDTGAEVDWSEVAYSALLGGLMGGMFEGLPLATNSIAEHSHNKAMGQNIKANDRVTDVFDIANNPEIADAYDTYTRYANRGVTTENISDVQLGRLYNKAKTETVETLNSKKSTTEQKENALKRLAEMSIIETENVVAKEKKNLNIGEETTVTESGETVNVKDLKVKGKDIVVTTEKGEVSVDDMTIKDKDADLVALARIIAREDGEDVANLFISQYDGETDVNAYANDFNRTMAYAKNNFSHNEILNKKGSLSAKQVSAIYQETRIKADKEKSEYIKKLNKEMADKGFYKGIIDESVIDYNNTDADGKVNWKDLTDRQRKAVTFIKGFAQAAGMNLTFVANDSKNNGKYDRETNTFIINLDEGGFDAINKIHETIIPTMSHETTHWMKEKSPELWRNLNEIVFSTLTEHYNSNTEQAINDKIALLDKLEPQVKHTEKDARGRAITEEDLIRAEMNRKGKSEDVSREEIIARACEDMLKMSEQGRKIFFSLSEAEQKTLVGKIKSLINDLLNWVNELLNSYEATSTEARIMREYKEQLQKASKVWDEMLKKSVVANQSLEKSGAYEHKKSTSEGDELEQAKEFDAEGNSYWQIETEKDIFAGIESVNELQKAAYNFILNGDKGNKIFSTIDGEKIEFIRVSAREYVYGEASKDLTTEEYKQKMRMSTSIIDLVENASIQYDSPDHKNHKLFPNGFRNYQGRVGIDETIFRYIVRVGKSKDGMIFYDINLEVDGKVPRANRTSLIKSSTSNDSILNSDKNVNTNFSDSERDYSYEAIISKPDMKLTEVGNNVPSNRADIVYQAIKNAKSVGKTNENGNAVVHVQDIDVDVVVPKRSIVHGLDRRLSTQAPVLVKVGEVLKNSIKINELTPKSENAKNTYVLIGAAVSKNNELYLASFVVNRFSNEVAEIDVLYSANAKKESAAFLPKITDKSATPTDSTISISDLLDYVNKYFPDILSESVLRHYNHSERPKGRIGENALFSEKEQSVYDIMGETERVVKENEKLDANAKKLKEIIGTEEIANRRFLGLSNYLKKLSGSTIDSAILGKRLKEVYSFMQSSKSLTWGNIASQTYSIAESIMSNDTGVSTEYFKRAMYEIRKDKISLNEEQRAMVEERFGGYGNFHKYVFGRINVTKDGKSLSEMWNTWSKKYPSLFDSNVSGAEQIDALIEAVDALKATSTIMGEYERSEAIRHLSTEIYNQFWNIAADNAKEDATSLRAEHKALMTELRRNYEKIQNDLVAHPIGETALKYEALLKKVKDSKKKEISLAKQHGREMMSKYKENAERKTVMQRITANALSLNEMLVKNSKDKHIPEIMKGPVTSLLQALDFSSKRMLEKSEPTRKDISLSKSLGKVKDMMVKATNAHEELVELYGHGLDEEIEAMVDSVDNIMRTVGDNEFVLNKMSLTDLQTLDKMVKTIKHAVNKLNKFHTVNHAKGIANLSQESIVYLDSLGKGKVYDGIRGKSSKLLNWGNALPYYVFKRYGSGGIKIYEALQDGWDKFAFNTKAIMDYANESYTSKEVNEWSEEVKIFKILIPATEEALADENYQPQYQEVQLTVPQIMSLYCLNKREQARGHLFKGGIRVADFKTKKGEIVSQSEGVIFTEKDIAKILNSLTDRQKSVADKLQRFMNDVCANWGNDVSMARFGYKAFGEPNYFPIQSDKNNLAVNDETEQPNSLFRLLNMSFTKATEEKANNRIVISDIFDVFAQHTSDMAKYNALALPVLDAFKWYNYTEKQDIAEGTFKTSGVKQSIESAFGKDGQSYFTTFLTDINGSQETDREQLSKSFMRNYKIASVGANLRVIALQPTSYVRASAIIDNKYLSKALVHKPKISKAETYCGIALWKSMGYFDTNIQRGVAEQIKHNETFRDKATDLSMKGAEVADKITWGYLWNACELEVREKRKDLKVGSEEFYTEIGKRLREVIYATQVVDSTMTRSQMMRSRKMYDQVMTNFASEPTLAYNMLQDAYMELSLDARRMGKKEAWKKNGKRIARVLYAYTMTNAVAALVESAFDALRDDDDEEMDMITFMKLYLSNFASDMSITGKIPYIKEIHSLIKGYSVSRSELAWMESSYKAVTGIYKNLQGKGKPITTIKNSIKTISYLSSLPFYNIYRDTMETLNKLDLFAEEELNEMFEDFFLYGILDEDE